MSSLESEIVNAGQNQAQDIELAKTEINNSM